MLAGQFRRITSYLKDYWAVHCDWSNMACSHIVCPQFLSFHYYSTPDLGVQRCKKLQNLLIWSAVFSQNVRKLKKTYVGILTNTYNQNSLKMVVFWNLIQVNNYEIVVNFFHISHNLTWYSAIVHKFTTIYTVCSTYELTKQFM